MISILFLGASKRVTLIEQFRAAADSLDVELTIFSAEKEERFYPISGVVDKVLSAPLFSDELFQVWLDNVISKYSIDIVIPNMDSATVALSKYRENGTSPAWLVVSSYGLCEKMNDKVLANNYFIEKSIPTFDNTSYYPKIIKDKLGYGAKNQKIIYNKQELDEYLDRIDDYIVQDYLPGDETTVDLYFTRTGKLHGYVLRDRLEVSDGEVMECITREANEDEKRLIEKISMLGQWEGCITLQYIRYQDKYYVVEINPRFGGGATCSIASGLNMPKYILQEFLGTEIDKPKYRVVHMMRARRDFYEYK